MNEQIYYYFTSSEFGIDDLNNEWIKVSTLDSLNDPFELKPYLRYESEKRKKYYKTYEEVSKEWGLLCFSKDWEEPLLWSHYADKNKGIAIGFEILQGQIIEVDYNSGPKRKEIELTENSSIDKNLFLDLAKIKYEKWKYENESRILVKLEDCVPSSSIILRLTGHPLFIKFANRLKVKEIVLGCKFDHKKEKKNIIKLAIRLGANVIPTREQWEGYKIVKSGTWDEKYLKLLIDFSIDNIKFRGNEELANSLKIFEEAFVNEKILDKKTKKSVLDKLAFISLQADLLMENNKNDNIKSALIELKSLIISNAALISLWENLQNRLDKIFN
jgi:hypothetical protein